VPAIPASMGETIFGKLKIIAFKLSCNIGYSALKKKTSKI